MEIISVSFNTPDLIDAMINSVRLVSPLPIRIIDGSNTEEFMRLSKEICGDYSNVRIEQLGYNIHHGRGLDYGISSSTEDWVLIIDSDSQIKQGLLEVLLYDKPYMGFGMQVNANGINVVKGILYLHPHFLLVNTNHYKSNQWKFRHCGAPAIEIMANTRDELKNVIPEYYQQYFVRGGRGTVSRFGYNL